MPYVITTSPPPSNNNILKLRAQLDQLRAGGTTNGAVTIAVFVVIKALETDLAWFEHRGRI